MKNNGNKNTMELFIVDIDCYDCELDNSFCSTRVTCSYDSAMEIVKTIRETSSADMIVECCTIFETCWNEDNELCRAREMFCDMYDEEIDWEEV